MNVWHEMKQHGNLSFPYIVYRVEVPNFLSAYPLHWHDEMEIIYVQSGEGTVTVQSHEFHVKKDDIVVIPPQTVHSIEQFQKSEMVYFNIVFSFSLLSNGKADICYDDFFKPIYTHQVQPPFFIECNDKLNVNILEPIKSLVETRDLPIEKKALLVKADLYKVVFYLYEASDKLSDNEKNLKNNYDKLKNLLLHVQKNYDKEISVADAAEICAFSESHFMKLFKELTGKPFTNYLIDYRLEMAVSRIATTDDKIATIATECGFNNLSYFTRKFVDKYGLTPSKYRKNN